MSGERMIEPSDYAVERLQPQSPECQGTHQPNDETPPPDQVEGGGND